MTETNPAMPDFADAVAEGAGRSGGAGEGAEGAGSLGTAGTTGPATAKSGTRTVASGGGKRPEASPIREGAAGGESVGDPGSEPATGPGGEPATGPGDAANAGQSDAELARVRAEHTLQQQLEALLIVADEPLSAMALATATDRPVSEVRAALEALIADFEGAGAGSHDEGSRASTNGKGSAEGSNGKGSAEGSHGERSADTPVAPEAPETPVRPRGFELREVAGDYRFYVRESLDPLVAGFVQQQTPSKLSQAALETLAVIAYRQPISRGAIAAIRAVNVDSVVRTLLGRGLITEVGQDPETTATLYGTTEALLGHLGIGDISELPPIAPLLDEPTEGFEHESL